MMSSSHRVPYRRYGVLAVVLILGVGLRLHLALTDHGIYHFDEIYQTLEPAHWLVFDYGFRSWEWLVGLRNWALPGVFAGLLELGRLVGWEEPWEYLGFIRVVLCILSAVAGLGLYRLARNYDIAPAWATIAPTLFMLTPFTIYLGHRALGGIVSAPALVWGLALALPLEHASEHHAERWLGFVLLSIASIIRMHNGLFCASLLAGAGLQGRWRLLGEMSLAFGIGALAYGALDWATWGTPFLSVLRYVQFNLLRGGAAESFGAMPPLYYLETLTTAAGLVPLCLMAIGLLALRRAPLLTITSLAILVVYSSFSHKELRFIYPLYALFCSLAAIGMAELSRHLRTSVEWERWLPLLAVVSLSLNAYVVYPDLTFRKLGHVRELGVAPGHSAFGYGDAQNRLLMRAHHIDSICGLDLGHAMFMGGQIYLHRDIPVFCIGRLSPSSDHVNAAITPTFVANRRSSFRRVETHGHLELLHTDRGCISDNGDGDAQLVPDVRAVRNFLEEYRLDRSRTSSPR